MYNSGPQVCVTKCDVLYLYIIYIYTYCCKEECQCTSDRIRIILKQRKKKVLFVRFLPFVSCFSFHNAALTSPLTFQLFFNVREFLLFSSLTSISSCRAILPRCVIGATIVGVTTPRCCWTIVHFYWNRLMNVLTLCLLLLSFFFSFHFIPFWFHFFFSLTFFSSSRKYSIFIYKH